MDWYEKNVRASYMASDSPLGKREKCSFIFKPLLKARFVDRLRTLNKLGTLGSSRNDYVVTQQFRRHATILSSHNYSAVTQRFCRTHRFYHHTQRFLKRLWRRLAASIFGHRKNFKERVVYIRLFFKLRRRLFCGLWFVTCSWLACGISRTEMSSKRVVLLFSFLS